MFYKGVEEMQYQKVVEKASRRVLCQVKDFGVNDAVLDIRPRPSWGHGFNLLIFAISVDLAILKLYESMEYCSHG